MRTITFQDEHRRRHFDFFRSMDQPHTGVTAEVDISRFLDKVKQSAELRFSPGLIYLLGRVAHELPVFRWRIRGAEVVEHERVDPSYSVPTKNSSVFSFCTVRYDIDPRIFHQAAVEMSERMWENPSLEDEPGRDDYLFMSALPWIKFTSLTHAMPRPVDSVPRISWGKYVEQEGKIMMPLAVQAHHALVDGRDLGDFYRLAQQYLDEADEIFVNF